MRLPSRKEIERAAFRLGMEWEAWQRQLAEKQVVYKLGREDSQYWINRNTGAACIPSPPRAIVLSSQNSAPILHTGTLPQAALNKKQAGHYDCPASFGSFSNSEYGGGDGQVYPVAGLEEKRISVEEESYQSGLSPATSQGQPRNSLRCPSPQE